MQSNGIKIAFQKITKNRPEAGGLALSVIRLGCTSLFNTSPKRDNMHFFTISLPLPFAKSWLIANNRPRL